MKKLICLFLTVVLCSVGFCAQGFMDYSTSTHTYFDYDRLDYKISHFLDNYVMFNDCDQVKDGDKEIVANLNSSKLNLSATEKTVSQGTGSAKFTKRYYNNCDIPITVRSDMEINLSEYQFLEFDLYLSQGLKSASVPDPELSANARYYYAHVYFQSKWCNSISDNTLYKADISGIFSELPSKAWTHFKVMVPETVSGNCVQFTLHLSDVMLRGETDDFLCIDNVRFTKSQGTRLLTIMDKPEVLRMQADYQALTDAQKKEVKNINLVNTWASQIQQMDEQHSDDAVLAVEQMIEKLPAPESITHSHKAEIEAVRAAYQQLSETQQMAVSNSNDLLLAETALTQALFQKEIQDVNDMIDALPARKDLTLDHKQALEETKKAYDALELSQKAYVFDQSKLYGLIDEMARLEATVADRIASVEQQIAALANTGVTRDRVQAAFDAYCRLAGSEKTQIANREDLFAAVREAVLSGDVDESGTTDAKDALLVLQSAVGKRTLTSWQQAVADLNEDTILNAVDALAILRLAVQ